MLPPIGTGPQQTSMERFIVANSEFLTQDDMIFAFCILGFRRMSMGGWSREEKAAAVSTSYSLSDDDRKVFWDVNSVSIPRF